MRTALFFCLLSASASASVLPEIFSAPTDTQRAVCREPRAERAEFWQALVADQLAVAERELPPQHPRAIRRNTLVTAGYLELFRHGTVAPVRLMGYVYAHASHHLGRLVRYDHWRRVDRSDSRAQALKTEDLRLLQGETLRRLVATFPRPLAARLMDFSLDLYLTLAPPLVAREVCGAGMALRAFSDPQLQEAFGTRHPLAFMHHFVGFEQSYLQTTMYRQVDVRLLAQRGVLDPMRFIPFNGEVAPSFADWCASTQCRVTSYDLAARVSFDHWAIEEEWAHTGGQFADMALRLDATPIDEVQTYFGQRD